MEHLSDNLGSLELDPLLGPKLVPFEPVLRELERRGIPHALAGGIALAWYTRLGRNGGDLDLFILEQHRDAAVHALEACGYGDYYAVKPYDRSWIYRGHKDGIILDLIWQMANHRAQVDHLWLSRGPSLTTHGHRVQLIAIEELIYAKIYVLQKDRTDWPELVGLMHDHAESLDWGRLMELMGDDLPLLTSVVALLAWISPVRARVIPRRVWGDLGLRRPSAGMKESATPAQRAARLDSRPWYAPLRRGEDAA